MYTLGNENRVDTVYCLDANDGGTVWTYEYPADPGQYPGPRATPAVYGKTLFIVTQAGELHCLERASGKLLWKQDLVLEYGAVLPEWGIAGSPIIRDDTLYLNVCRAGVALDAASGDLLWKTESEMCGYASPVFMEAGGGLSVVMFGANAVYGVDASNGEILWDHDWVTGYDVNAADPLVFDNKVFISSGYSKGAAVLEIEAGKARVKWQNLVFRSHFSSFVYADGYIYGNDGDANSHRGTFKCISAETGEPLWEYRDALGSLMIVGEYLITLTERRRVAVVELSHEEYREIASCELPKGLIWSPPVFAGGTLFVRGMQGRLYAVRA